MEQNLVLLKISNSNNSIRSPNAHWNSTGNRSNRSDTSPKVSKLHLPGPRQDRRSETSWVFGVFEIGNGNCRLWGWRKSTQDLIWHSFNAIQWAIIWEWRRSRKKSRRYCYCITHRAIEAIKERVWIISNGSSNSLVERFRINKHGRQWLEHIHVYRQLRIKVCITRKPRVV